MYFTYDIVRRVPAHIIHKEHRFGSDTIAALALFCRETMLAYMEGCSEKICSPNKNAEIEESKFGRHKYHRGPPVKGCFVVLSASPVKHFSFPFQTEPPTL